MNDKRILLVDDETNILSSLKRQLRKLGAEILTAENGLEGLDILARQGPISVIISDFQMPRMDGIEFLSRAEKMCPETTRMMLTGKADIQVALAAVNHGKIFRFMIKPVPAVDLLVATEAALEQNELVSSKRKLLEELSVLQHIDRELNSTLDTERAMWITLHWAMQQSDAMAGFCGSYVDGETIHVLAQQGFPENTFSTATPVIANEEIPGLSQILSRGDPQTFSTGTGLKTFHPEALFQTIIPIQREQTVIAVLLLESKAPIPQEILNFLDRLSDHASIAISNGELYSAVQAANLAKSEFVSFVAHELRNPMTSIMGYTDIIASGKVGPINEKQLSFLTIIKSTSTFMATLVSDLADVSRIESGHLRLEPSTHTVPELVTQVLRSLNNQIEDKKQEISIQVPENLPEIWADRLRTVQIITNLVSNANKYTPAEGKIAIRAEECEEHRNGNGLARMVHIAVQDNGLGISTEDQKQLFQKFFRSNNPDARNVHGTGLGLNITKRLIEMQGGRIWCESELQKGTTFHFTIPIAN